jgi:AraC family transcriptional regulator
VAPPIDRSLTAFSVVRRGPESRGPNPFAHENVGHEVTWVESGGIDFAIGGRVLSARAGDAVIVPPALENTPSGPGGVLHQITIAPAIVAEAARALPGAAPPVAGVVVGDRGVPALARLVAREIDSGLGCDDPGLAALIDALAVALVRPAPAAPAALDPRIRRALDHMQGELAAPLTVDDLAATAGMSRFAFLRAFKAQVGASPYQYLLALRLDRAAERLRAGGDGVLAIALDCGFADPGRFARMFRARFGCAPREMRGTNRR